VSVWLSKHQRGARDDDANYVFIVDDDDDAKCIFILAAHAFERHDKRPHQASSGVVADARFPTWWCVAQGASQGAI
jgi:hypothetical protein